MPTFVDGPFDGGRCPLGEPPSTLTLPVCDALVRAMTGRMPVADLLNKKILGQTADRAAVYALETSANGSVYRFQRDVPLSQ